MGERALITGGAGFIGSPLADELLRAGYPVRVLDNLLPRVYGPLDRPPAQLSPEVEFVKGDMRDRQAVRPALPGVLDKPGEPVITGKCRTGDIRHCFADISKARAVLGCEPQTRPEDGLVEWADWLVEQTAVDRADQATRELERRGLTL